MDAGADLTARAVAKLLAHMDSHGYTHAYPHLGDKPMPEKPAWNINAGYVQRAGHVLPKSGTHRPWNVRHNYVLDAIDHRFDRIDESMVFGRADVESGDVRVGGNPVTDHSDVLIIGAGVAGIGAAYRIHEKNPSLSYTILERRSASAARGICSSIPAFGRTATSSPSVSRGSRGPDRR